MPKLFLGQDHQFWSKHNQSRRGSSFPLPRCCSIHLNHTEPLILGHFPNKQWSGKGFGPESSAARSSADPIGSISWVSTGGQGEHPLPRALLQQSVQEGAGVLRAGEDTCLHSERRRTSTAWPVSPCEALSTRLKAAGSEKPPGKPSELPAGPGAVYLSSLDFQSSQGFPRG